MSTAPIPTRHRLEYLVYLGLTAPWVTLLSFALPFGEKGFFIVTISSISALVLFISRIDKRIDPWLIDRIIKNESDLSGFMSSMWAFLRLWELYPVEIEPFNIQVRNLARSVVEGEDLHDDVWMLKLIVFLVPSSLGAFLALPFSLGQELVITLWQSYSFTLSGLVVCIGLIAWVLISLLLKSLWTSRAHEFALRGVDTLKFRYYGGLLHREASLRYVIREGRMVHKPAKKPHHPDSTIRWGKDDLREYKDTLVELGKFLVDAMPRREWYRILTHVSEISTIVYQVRDDFLRDEAYDFLVMATADSIAPPEHVIPAFADVRLANMVICIEEILKSDTTVPTEKLQHFISQVETAQSSVCSLLDKVEIHGMSDSAYENLGRLVTEKVTDLLNNRDTMHTLLSRLENNKGTATGMLRLLAEVDVFPRDAILGAMEGDVEQVVNHLLSILPRLDFLTKSIALEVLGELGSTSGSVEHVSKAISKNVKGGGYDLGRKAIDSLGRLGLEAMKTEEAIDALSWALRSGNIRQQVMVTLTHVGVDQELIRNLRESLLALVPNRNPFLETIILSFLRRSSFGDDDIGKTMWDIAVEKWKLKDPSWTPTDMTNSRLETLLREDCICSSDTGKALGCIAELANRSDKWSGNEEHVMSLISCLSKGNGVAAEIRLSITSLLLSHDGPVRCTVSNLRRVLKEKADGVAQALSLFGYVISSLDPECVEFVLARARLDWKLASCVLACSSVRTTDPDIIRMIAEKASPTSPEDASVALLALKSIGEEALIADNTMNIVEEILTRSGNAELLLYTLLFLESVQNRQVQDVLKKHRNQLRFWAERRLAERVCSLTTSDFFG